MSEDLAKKILDSVCTLFAVGNYPVTWSRFERPCRLFNEPKNLAHDFFCLVTVRRHFRNMNPSKTHDACRLHLSRGLG